MKTVYKSRRHVNAAIIANLRIPAIERPEWQEVAKTLKVDIQVIYDQINRLRKGGHIPAAGEDLVAPDDTRRARLAAEGKPADGSAPEPKVRRKGTVDDPEALTGDDIPAPERRKRLATLVDEGSDATKIKAIEVLNRMDEASDRGIGPREPMGDDEKVKRLADLNMAVGENVAKRAMEVAFGAKTKGEEITTPESQ